MDRDRVRTLFFEPDPGCLRTGDPESEKYNSLSMSLLKFGDLEKSMLSGPGDVS